MTHRRTWQLALLGLSGVAVLFATPVTGQGDVGPKPKTAPVAPPPPRGLLIGKPAEVIVFTDRWHGELGTKPFARCAGAFRLANFPYASSGRYSSVFFVRKGFFPTHFAVRGRTKAMRTGPDLGKVLLKRLPAKQAGVTVAVVSRASGEIQRYVDAEVKLIPAAGGAPIEGRAALGICQLSAPPGNYRVRLEGQGTDAQRVQLEAGQGLPVVLNVD